MVAGRLRVYGEGMTTLEERIAARLGLALIHQERAGFEAFGAERGLATGGPAEPVIRLTVEDVARIAAQVAVESFSTGD